MSTPGGASDMHPVFIDGGWVSLGESPALTVTNPATLAPLASVPACTPPTIDRALGAACAAAGAWSALAPADRARHLEAAADSVAASAGSLARVSTSESGMPILESRDVVASVVALLRRGANAATRGAPASAEGRSPRIVLSAAECPLLDLAARIVPALATGTVVVCRPPPTAPLASLLLAERLELPPGVIAVLTGGAETAQCLVDHPAVGSLSSAQARLHAAPLDLLAVPRDADLEFAVGAVLAQRLFDTGQRAMCPTVYVEQPHAAAFAEQLHTALAFLEVGDPAKPITDLGPLLSAAASTALEANVAQALKRGGRLVLGARRFQPWGLTGFFFQPTLFTRARPEPWQLGERLAGPVITVCAVEDLAGTLAGLLSGRAARLTLCGGEPARATALLAHAGLACVPASTLEEPLDAHPLLVRMAASIAADQTPGGGATHAVVALEHITERASWWHPYAERRAAASAGP